MSWYLWDQQPGSRLWPCRACWLRVGSGLGLCRRTTGPQSDPSLGISAPAPCRHRLPTYRFLSGSGPHCSLWCQCRHRTWVAPRSGKCRWLTCLSISGSLEGRGWLEGNETEGFNRTLIILFTYLLSLSSLISHIFYLLAGEETLTGSSMYAGSPGPHLLQAVTLNRYSFPSTTSVTVNSWSWIPVTT